MKTILAIIKKEFLQISRNKVLMKIILIVPVVQLIVLVFAANLEVESLSLGFVELNNSSMSQKIRNSLTSSDYFVLRPSSKSYEIAIEEFENDKADVIIEIPANFERDVVRGDKPRISVMINAINSMKAGVASSYINITLSQIAAEFAAKMPQSKTPRFEITYSDWYNPNYNYKAFMISAILCVLITIIGVLISALNIVREKEIGTIEQLNVTPITKVQFIIGKLLPFWIIGIVQLTLGLIAAVLIFDLDIQGNIFLIYSMVTIYLLGILGIGFLISTISETQAQAMFMSLFFIYLAILLSGLLTPIESMPLWAQKITLFNPTAYMIDSIRLIILKGSDFSDIRCNFCIITVFAVVINSTVILKYRKMS